MNQKTPQETFIKKYNHITEILKSQLYVLSLLNIYIKTQPVFFYILSGTFILYTIYFLSKIDISKKKNTFHSYTLTRSEITFICECLTSLLLFINITISFILLIFVTPILTFKYFLSIHLVAFSIGLLLFGLYDLINFNIKYRFLRNGFKSVVTVFVFMFNLVYDQRYDCKSLVMPENFWCEMTIQKFVFAFLVVFMVRLMRILVVGGRGLGYVKECVFGVVAVVFLIIFSHQNVVLILLKYNFDFNRYY